MKTKTQPARRLTRRSAEERAALIREYERSGMSKSAFCRLHGVNVKTFCQWVGVKSERRIVRAPSGRRGIGSKVVEKPAKVKTVGGSCGFAEITVSTTQGSPIELVLSRGLCIRINDLRHVNVALEMVEHLERVGADVGGGKVGC